MALLGIIALLVSNFRCGFHCCVSLVRVWSVVNYDVVRAGAKNAFTEEINEVRAYVSKLQKAQRAGEKALDMYVLVHFRIAFCNFLFRS